MTPVTRVRVVLAVALTTLASVGYAVGASATTPSGTAPRAGPVTLQSRTKPAVTTAWTSDNCSPNPFQAQSSGEGEVELSQSPNGDLRGCFRVPSLRTSKLLVALQAYANRTVPASTQVITDVSTSPSDGDFTLSASTRRVTPGQTLTLYVHYAGARPSGIDGTPDLCWDGCQDGLLEQFHVLHWVSHSEFRVAFNVPDAAWFEERGKTAFVHPLTSGNYSIGIGCIVVSSGCELEPADAQVSVHLNAPPTTRCLTETKCAYLSFSQGAAEVGDVISVRGWAPLQSIIGLPFGLNLTVTRARAHQSYAPFTATVDSKYAFDLVFARRAFTVHRDETWANLGTVHPLTSTWSGVSDVAPERGSHSIAWCQPTSIEETGGARIETVATSGVPLALKKTDFRNRPAQPDPQCSSVLLDPRRASTVYAGFFEAVNGNAPPLNLVGLYTTDAGTTWHLVPAPPGLNISDFEGFTTDAQGVEAIFAVPYSDDDGIASDITINTESTSNGGLTWSPSTLGCAAVGPCVNFGPYPWVNCAMGGTGQPFLLGSPTTSINPNNEVWSSTSWVTLVNTCFSQQLAATSPDDAILLDPSSPYPLLRSTDGGRTWANIALPAIPHSTLSDEDPNQSNSLLLTPHGILFAALENSADSKQQLFRLNPGATSWCVVPGVFGTLTAAGVAGPLRSSENDVAWMQSADNASSSATSLHVRSVSSLHC